MMVFRGGETLKTMTSKFLDWTAEHFLTALGFKELQFFLGANTICDGCYVFWILRGMTGVWWLGDLSQGNIWNLDPQEILIVVNKRMRRGVLCSQTLESMLSGWELGVFCSKCCWCHCLVTSSRGLSRENNLDLLLGGAITISSFKRSWISLEWTRNGCVMIPYSNVQ